MKKNTTTKANTYKVWLSTNEDDEYVEITLRDS